MSPRAYTRHLVIALTAGAALLTAGCDSEHPPDRVRAQAGLPLRVEAEPRTGVGVLDGDPIQQFKGVMTPFVLKDGRLVVPVSGDGVIRIFDGAGDHVESLGGTGEGPGEFRSLDAVWARGDTVEAFDSELRRITRFFPDGGSDVVVLDAAGPAQAAVPGALSDGWAFVSVAEIGDDGRDRMVVHRFGLDGSHRGAVAQVAGMVRHRTGRGTGPAPLSPRATFAVHDGHLYAAETLSPMVQVLDSAGQLTRTLTWTAERGESPAEAAVAVVNALVARAGADQAEATRQRFEAFPVPDTLSCFWDFIVDKLGFVWVRPYEAEKHSVYLGGATNGGAGPGGEWLVLSPSGTVVGSVRIPPSLEPAQITENAVVGIEHDSYGVEYVRVHSLVRQ